MNLLPTKAEGQATALAGGLLLFDELVATFVAMLKEFFELGFCAFGYIDSVYILEGRTANSYQGVW